MSKSTTKEIFSQTTIIQFILRTSQNWVLFRQNDWCTYLVFWIRTHGRVPGKHEPLSVQFVSFSCSFLGKDWSKYRLAPLDLERLPYGESWIYHYLIHLPLILPSLNLICMNTQNISKCALQYQPSLHNIKTH